MPHTRNFLRMLNQLPSAFGTPAKAPNNLAGQAQAAPQRHHAQWCAAEGQCCNQLRACEQGGCPGVCTLLVAMPRQACHARTTIHLLLPEHRLPCWPLAPT